MDPKRQREIGLAIAERLAEARQNAGLTQEQVAERLGIGNEAVSRMERGATAPTIARLFEFAELYGCRVDRLIIDSSDREIDQAATIVRQLSGLSVADRALVASIIERLTSHMRRERSGERTH